VAIPKIIHYVWVGNEVPLPEDYLRYIEGWQKLNPDFKIKRWSEKDIDLKKYPLVKKAIDEKRWALAADIIRMYAVYEEGGFYLDTDVELLKPLGELTKYRGVAGWESNFWFTTAAFGAEKHSPWIGKVLKRYEFADIKKPITTDTFLKTVHSPSVYAQDFWPLKLDGETRVYNDEFAVFSREYFSPKHYMTGKDESTENTIAFHHYASTWHTRIEAFKNFASRAGYKTLGPKNFAKLERQFNRKLEKQIRKEYN
jgi:mannosyltransferase OCH1-like enzyme